MDPDEMIFKIHEDLPRQGVGRDRYTRRAYEMLPALDEPRILDIGCGSGAPTLELARISGGQVIGVDVHRPYLDDLVRRAEEAGLADRVTAVEGSMLSLDYPDESFDLVWAEGSIFIVGFDQGLEDWRRLIRPGGFLVVHDVAWLRPDPPAELLPAQAEVFDQGGTGAGLLNRIQVLSHHVLDQRDFQPVGLVRVANHHRDPLDSGDLGRSPSSLPGYEFVTSVTKCPYDQWLYHSAGRDRLRQPPQRVIVEPGPGLPRVGLDQLDRDLPHFRPGGGLRKNRPQAAAHSASLSHAQSLPRPGSCRRLIHVSWEHSR